MSKTYYEHLGAEITDDLYNIHLESIDPEYSNINKPRGGLWGCRLNNRDENYFDWRSWCEGEDFHTDYYNDDNNQYVFSLKENGNILTFSGDDIMKHIKDPIKTCFGYISSDEFDKIYNNLSDKDILLPIDKCREYVDSNNFVLRINWKHVIQNYDGFELLHGEYYGLLHYNGFYSWDCDSIVIWNPKIVNDLTYLYRQNKKNGVQNPWE